MEQCIAFFQEKNYTKNRIGVYKTLWKSGIVPFMEAQGLKVYNPSIGAMFIDTLSLITHLTLPTIYSV